MQQEKNPFRNFNFSFNSLIEPGDATVGLHLNITHPDFPGFKLSNKAECTDKFLRMEPRLLDEMMGRLIKRTVQDMSLMLQYGSAELSETEQPIFYNEKEQKWFSVETIYEKD